MRNHPQTTILGMLVGLLLATGSARGQAFDLGWYTIDGGGGMWSTGGDFAVGGTIGQPDAQRPPVMTGGDFELTGGFWAVKARHPGDLNCDGVVNFDDINPFVLALSNPAAYVAAYPNCDILNGDLNADGLMNFDDINPFVTLLSHP